MSPSFDCSWLYIQVTRSFAAVLGMSFRPILQSLTAHVRCFCLWLQLSTDQVAGALRVSSGALIQSVGPNSAAAKAGLLPTRRGLTGIITGVVTFFWSNPRAVLPRTESCFSLLHACLWLLPATLFY